jgi:hypothetical protein
MTGSRNPALQNHVSHTKPSPCKMRVLLPNRNEILYSHSGTADDASVTQYHAVLTGVWRRFGGEKYLHLRGPA